MHAGYNQVVEISHPNLSPRLTPAAGVLPITGGWRLSIPPGTGGAYRLAQLDDYAHRSRRSFPWDPPLTFSLQVRLSHPGLPGTWGFGLWNDPFGLSLGFGGKAGRLPALPNAAWFFHASKPNYLSLRDDLPARGFLAATFRSPNWPSILFTPALPGLGLLALPPFRRWLRRAVGSIVQQDAVSVGLEVQEWHAYQITWQSNTVRFGVDGGTILETDVSPNPPLALVLWLDNQFAAWEPSGNIHYGTLENPSAWLELRALRCERL